MLGADARDRVPLMAPVAPRDWVAVSKGVTELSSRARAPMVPAVGVACLETADWIPTAAIQYLSVT